MNYLVGFLLKLVLIRINTEVQSQSLVEKKAQKGLFKVCVERDSLPATRRERTLGEINLVVLQICDNFTEGDAGKR